MTGSDVTGSDVSHCQEECSAHVQPEIAPYLLKWGVLTGSDVSNVTEIGTVRKWP